MTGQDERYGNELWVSQGTTETTRMLKDVFPGPDNPGISQLTTSGNKVFFSANDGVHGQRLWVTDGTEAGTRIAAPIFTSGTYGISPSNLTAFQGGVIFTSTFTTTLSVWFSDGTVPGTRLLHQQTQNSIFSIGMLTHTMVVQATPTTAYLFLPNAANDRLVLWATDGTAVGTAAIWNVTKSTNVQPWMQGNLGDTLLFTLRTAGSDYQLWKSDGTSAGTTLVKTLSTAQTLVPTTRMVVIGDQGYLISIKAGASYGVPWVTDGTTAGTRLLSDVVTMPSTLGMERLTPLGSNLVAGSYTAFGSNSGGLYLINLQAGSSTELKAIGQLGNNQRIFTMTSTGNQVFFAAGHGSTFAETLWVTDGTVAGTKTPTSDFALPTRVRLDNSNTFRLCAAAGSVYFAASKNASGDELWRTDGTEAGTAMLTDLKLPDGSSRPSRLCATAGGVYFSADDGVHGRELWFSDGSRLNTSLVKDLMPGASSSNPVPLGESFGGVYFMTDMHSGPSKSLWRTDSTEEGTVKLLDSLTIPLTHGKAQTCSFGGRFYFAAGDSSQGVELWRSDGTPEGTVLFAALQAAGDSSPADFSVMDGWLYFTAQGTGDSERCLYRTNGTAESVARVSSSVQGVNNLLVRPPSPGATVEPDESVLYFLGITESGYTALYRYCSGEEPVEVFTFNVVSHNLDTQASKLYRSGSRIFIGVAGTSFSYIWRSDGTEAGTAWLRTGNDGAHLLTVLGERIYFQDNAHGSTEATGLRSMNLMGQGIVNHFPDESYPQVRFMHAAGQTVFFAHYEAGGWKLWETQGSPATTRRVTTHALSVDSSGELERPAQYDHELLYSARDLSTAQGYELHSVFFDSAPDQLAELYIHTPDGETFRYGSDGAPSLESGLAGLQLVLRNQSGDRFTEVALNRDFGNPNSVEELVTSLLDPGQEVAVPYTIPTAGADPLNHRLRVDSDPPTTLSFTVGPVQRPTGALFDWVSATRLVPVGQPVSFATLLDPTQEILGYTWRRDKKVLGTAAVLSLEAAQLSDGGTYTQQVKYQPASSTKPSTTTSPAMRLGVVQPAPATATAYVGKPLILTCIAVGPAGLGYDWYHNDTRLTPESGIKGLGTGKIEIPANHELRSGIFECFVILGGTDREVRLSHGETLVTEAMAPAIVEVEPTLLQRYVGEEISLQLTTTDPASRFTAKKLPTGLTMDAAGLITGRFTQSGTFTSTITASNPAGTGASQTLVWTVLPALDLGSYEGLIERKADLDTDLALGSRVSLTVSKTGTFSGQLMHGGKAWRFTSKTVTVETEPEEDPTVTILISQGKNLPSLTLNVDTETEELTLTDGTANAVGQLRRVAFDKATPATDYAADYTGQFERQIAIEDQNHPDIPAGLGFFTGTLSKTGIFSWKGKLADGTPITGSTPLTLGHADTQHHVAVHVPLYKGTGSVHGWAKITEPDNHQIHGPLTWSKAAETGKRGRLYPDGIPEHMLNLSAAPYTAPDKGSLLFGVVDEADNLGLILFGPDMVPGSPFRNIISLRSGNKIYPPALSPTSPLKSLTLNGAKGTFKGTLIFLHDSDPKLNRTVTAEGVLLPELGGAVGFFLLPELPDETTTLKTSRLRSCSIDFHPR